MSRAEPANILKEGVAVYGMHQKKYPHEGAGIKPHLNPGVVSKQFRAGSEQNKGISREIIDREHSKDITADCDTGIGPVHHPHEISVEWFRNVRGSITPGRLKLCCVDSSGSRSRDRISPENGRSA